MEAQPSGGEDAEPVSYKILLLGEGAVGKSSFTRRLCRPSEAQQNPNWYLPTIGVETSSVLLHTSRGQILLNLYDTSGKGCLLLPLTPPTASSSFVRRVPYDAINADGFLLFFDVTHVYSYKNIFAWYKDVVQWAGSRPKPIVICGNKVKSAFSNQICSISLPPPPQLRWICGQTGKLDTAA